MTVLLLPKMAIDGAALQQFVVRTEVNHLAAIEYEGLVAIYQRREAVRNYHHRPTARHALEIAVY